jgi:hypothetical protein
MSIETRRKFDARKETIFRKAFECETMFSDVEVQTLIRGGGRLYGYQSPNWVAPTSSEVPEPLKYFAFDANSSSYRIFIPRIDSATKPVRR